MTVSSSKYSRTERERKFLLNDHMDLVMELPYKLITDHYIKGLRLRFREVIDDGCKVCKLTQKSDSIRGTSQLTTIYLSQTEFELLNVFPAVSVKKTRYIKAYDALVIAIDKYSKENDELWLAEVEFDSDEEMDKFVMPIDHIKEVTDNPDFNGFVLAERFGIDSNGLY
jgi:CYTH domain-containing protein